MSLLKTGAFKRYIIVIKKQLIIVLVVSLFFLLTGLYWLSAGIALLSFVYFAVLAVPVIRKRYFLAVPLLLLFVICLSVFTRLFVLEVYVVPSQSMENNLYPGDHIILSKLNYGPKLPRSPFEIPWVNLFFYASKTALAKGNTAWWDYHRWSGFSEIKHNDVVVFKRGFDAGEFLVKRCIGLAGDTLHIENGQIYLNGMYIKDYPGVKFPYVLEVEDELQFGKLADSLGLSYTVADKKNGRIFIYAKLSNADFRFFQKNNLRNVYRMIDGNNSYPMKALPNWTVDNFGPLVIPKKGMQIQLNVLNYNLYEGIFRTIENAPVVQRNGRFYLNGRPVTQYTFKHDYYFMMGDNRGDSNDSRFWGFVAAQDIEGKAVCAIGTSKAVGWLRVLF